MKLCALVLLITSWRNVQILALMRALQSIVGRCLTLLLRGPNDEKDLHSGARMGMNLALLLIHFITPKSKGRAIGEEPKVKFIRHSNRVYATRGLILTAAECASCACLDQLAASAKQEEKTRKCESCIKEAPYKEAWIVEDANILCCCSKECQAEHW